MYLQTLRYSDEDGRLDAVSCCAEARRVATRKNPTISSGNRSNNINIEMQNFLTVRVESCFNLPKQLLARLNLVRFEVSSSALRSVVVVVLIQSFLQNSQDILLLEQQSALQVSEAAVQREDFVAALECREVWVAPFKFVY
jgi:hypothetical protein